MLDVRIVHGGSLRNVERIISSDPSHEQTSSVFCDRWMVFGGALRRLLGAVTSSLMYPKDVELIIPFALPADVEALPQRSDGRGRRTRLREGHLGGALELRPEGRCADEGIVCCS